MPLLFLHLHTCKCLITCLIHILKYCLRHNGSNIYMPKKYLSATLWETICTHFSHLRWIFSIFRHNKAATFAEYSPYSGITKLPLSLNILHTQAQQIVPHACQQTVCQLPTIYTIALKFHNSATHKPQTYGQIHRARLSAVIVSWLNIPRLRLHLFPFRGRIHIRRHGKSAPTAANNLPSVTNKQPYCC